MATTHDAPAARWLTVRDAAEFLGESPITLRRRCVANARPVDGALEARFDGLVARKLGGAWKVFLPPAWRGPLP
jgi:hypothetical protein